LLACRLNKCSDRNGLDGDYGYNERCTVRAEVALLASAQGSFSVERRYDWLTIGGTRYSGTSGPASVVMSAGETLHWLSDSSNVDSGFTIYAVIVPPPYPPQPPPPPTPPAPPPLPPLAPGLHLLHSGVDTLQTVLNLANDGDQLILTDGTYTGSGSTELNIRKSITIRAQNAGQATTMWRWLRCVLE
jgi:hypothetical protein